MFGLSDVQFQSFIERVSATAIANQAILKCLASGMPLTVDNAILFVGDFFDPGNPEFAGLIEKIDGAITYVVELQLSNLDPETPKDNVFSLFC